MLILYGVPLSAPVNKVRYTLNHIGIEYAFKEVNLAKGEGQKPEYLAIHPAGKVPAIDDEGFVLFESSAICKYLAEKHNSLLYPKELHRRALVDQWMDFSGMHVGAAVGKLLFNRLFAPHLPGGVDERSVEDGKKFLNRFLPIVDRQLGQSRYLADDDLSLADLTLLAATDPAEVCGWDLAPYQHLTRWRKALTGESFYTRCFKRYADALPAGLLKT